MQNTTSTILEKHFFAPLDRPRTRKAGIELELPICNLDPAQPVDFTVVHQVTEIFLSDFNFTPVALDGEGFAYQARESVHGDELSFDCSYNTVEFSFAPTLDLLEVEARFHTYYRRLRDLLHGRGHTITGMGVNPRWRINSRKPIQTSRYRMLLKFLEGYPGHNRILPFHAYPHFGLFSCASQVQLDVDRGTTLQAINTFTLLEPFKSVLFANSPFGRRFTLLCARDRFWRDSMHGLNPHNCDLYRLPFRHLREIRAYLATTSIYNVERDGVFIHFTPMAFADFLQQDEVVGEAVEATGFRRTSFHPEPDDVRFLRPFKFEDLTHRGTLEFRSVCAQPASEALAFAAFHAGLMERLDKLDEILSTDETIYGHGYNVTELRESFNRRAWPTFVNRPRLAERLGKILDLAAEGCAARGGNEARLLAPLYSRAERLASPGREFAEALDQGVEMNALIERFGEV